nr:DUF448 domain-containing protein [Desulfocurvibacter africanus]
MHAEMSTPVRMCVICRRRFPKRELKRHVACGAGAQEQPGLVHDPRQTMQGRGYYVCSDEACERRLAGYRARQKKCKGVAHGR